MANIIYYVPHQDDEILTFGASVIHHIMQGHQVHLVFYTDGSSTKAIQYFDGSESCPLHGENHNFGWGREELIEARNREMIWSSLCLGVSPEHFHWRQHAKDGQFSCEQGLQIILEFENKFPKAYHMGITYKDPHPDHANMGKALLKLIEQKKLSHARFYIKTVQLDEIDGIEEPCQEAYIPFLHAALQTYKIYRPAANMYAVGYHSVSTTFDTQHAFPRSKYHLANK